MSILLFLLFFLQIFIMVGLRFKGNFHPFYANAYKFFTDPMKFSFDLYLNNSILFDSTIYYTLISFFGATSLDDKFLLIIFLVLSAVNFVFFTKIVMRFYQSRNFNQTIIYLIPVMHLGNFLALSPSFRINM